MKRIVIGASVAIAAAGLMDREVGASSHGEAPFITENPKVDGTDFYMFRSYEPDRAGFVTLIANYLPVQDAYGGPNFFNLDPKALYEIHIDNDGDAAEDITFRFQFDEELAGDGGLALDVGEGDNVRSIAVPFINIGPISAGDTSNLNRRETYTIELVRGDRQTGEVTRISEVDGDATFDKPVDNIGTKSIPNYEAYASAHRYQIEIPGCDGPAGRVFVGQRKEGFSVALGEIFDLINLNPLGARDQGLNDLDGKNVTTLALEIPIACLTAGDSTIIGGWTTSSLRQAQVINPNPTFADPAREGGPWIQVSRLGMPLVNEVVIGLKDKNLFNVSEPSGDAQFIDYITHPTLPEVVEILFGAAGVQAPDLFPRLDLVAAFATGVEGVNLTATPSEMQRLNTAIPPTARGAQNSLGAAQCFVLGELDLENPGCDPAGFPNGRRPGDDVVDIEIRVAMGFLLPLAMAPSGQLPYTDGALVQAGSFDPGFPYLVTPIPGSAQLSPGEAP